MKIFKVNPENLRESEDAIIEAAKVMLAGGTVVFPTDTVYGSGCDATNEQAVKKIFKIKNRPICRLESFDGFFKAFASVYAIFE